MLSAIFFPIFRSLQAKVTAVGLLFTTSIAKLGPDKTARGLLGIMASAISLIRLNVSISMPLEHKTIGIVS